MNHALKTLYFYNGIFVLAGGLFGPLYGIYVQAIDPDVLVISLSWAIFLISSVAFTFVISRVGDTLKEKEYLLLAGFLLRALAWFLYIFVGSVPFLFALQVLLGLGDALGSPSYDSLVAEHLDPGRHIKEYSDMKIIFNLSGALATVLGGLLVARFGFTSLFLSMSVLALISFFGILLKPRALL